MAEDTLARMFWSRVEKSADRPAQQFKRGADWKTLTWREVGDTVRELALEGQSRALLAGERAPDAPLRGRAGQPTRLFELFKGGHFTLLGYGVERDLVPARPGLHIHTFGPRGDLVDAAQHVQRAYGLAPRDWVLVRPDGYIAAIVTSDQLAALELYLARVGLGSI